jgi:hypothetical protein
MGKIANDIAKALQVGEERQEKREVRKVAKVKKVAKPEAEEVDEAPKGKKAKGKPVKAEKAEKTNGKAAKKSGNGESRGPQEVPEGHVSVAQLAEEAEITAQSARVKLRSSEIERPEGRWVWPEGSKALKKAREILGL